MNEQFWTIFYFSVNCLECLVFLMFPTFIMKSRINKLLHIAYFTIAFFIMMLVEYAYDILGASQTLVLIAITALYSIISLKGTVIKKISISIISVFINGIVFVPIIFALSMVFGIYTDEIFGSNIYNITVVIVVHIVAWMVLFLLSFFIKEKGNLNITQWISISVLFISAEIANSLLIKYTDYISISPGEQYVFLGVSICIFVIAMVGFVTISKFSKENNLKIENELLKKEKQLNERNLETIKRGNEEISSIKHDFKSYIFTINSYIRNGDYEKAKEECHKITGDLDKVETFVTSTSPMISLILNEKIKECRQKNIDIKCKSISNLNIAEKEFVLVFTNLINNAIEASIKEDINARYVGIEIYEKMGFVILKIENHIKVSVLQNNAKLNTTKLDGKNHGIGHKNVKKILKEIGGEIKYRENNNNFIAEAIFPKK